MTTPAPLTFAALDLDAVAAAEGIVAVFLDEDGKLDQGARRVNRLTRGALERFAASEAFGKLAAGEARTLAYPTGLAAEAVVVVKLNRRPGVAAARKAGVEVAKAAGGKAVLALAGAIKGVADIALGIALRGYDYTEMKSGEPAEEAGAVTLMVTKPEAAEAEAEAAGVAACAEGVFFTRDLVNAPANKLTTTAFAERLVELSELGVEVEVLDEDQLAELGMGGLLAVGQGSVSPSKVVVLQWNGGASGTPPFALVGKGVVFDSGGISIKPGAGMEEMTMDMGGAGTVAGVMKTLARRGAQANVVGLVGLVENMPDGAAYRPGDVITTMKGDTVEIINTDAEGRMVLADVLWYAQERFHPAGMVDLATLTGAMMIALGGENAGVFCNEDALCGAFLKAAEAEGEGAWRMPLGEGYAKLLKSRVADVKHVGGRPAGAITAAEFLHRFVQDGVPWMHIDIAGVAWNTSAETTYAPKGATGWGVLALDRLVRDRYES
ncbi:leucyl aminopeptidase [Tranquillimonas rosea]|uniref:Probable cytosol aminopeptidase n=1 Tax=Tranquillimonas rosea TaxID=641238 RepID=A0A1H9PJK3_9RHOB|nr:leucyl aminopeptidase [Tranquillimonas rosea]SER48344.1 leucyl aminopeptidase [Tranquillimonas rosea]